MLPSISIDDGVLLYRRFAASADVLDGLDDVLLGLQRFWISSADSTKQCSKAGARARLGSRAAVGDGAEPELVLELELEVELELGLELERNLERL